MHPGITSCTATWQHLVAWFGLSSQKLCKAINVAETQENEPAERAKHGHAVFGVRCAARPDLRCNIEIWHSQQSAAL